MRKPVRNKRGDKRFFRRTAQKTKKINLPGLIQRGGMRL